MSRREDESRALLHLQKFSRGRKLVGLVPVEDAPSDDGNSDSDEHEIEQHRSSSEAPSIDSSLERLDLLDENPKSPDFIENSDCEEETPLTHSYSHSVLSPAAQSRAVLYIERNIRVVVGIPPYLLSCLIFALTTLGCFIAEIVAVKHFNLKNFRSTLAQELLQSTRTPAITTPVDVIQAPVKPRPPEAVRYDGVVHWQDFTTSGRCNYCKNNKAEVYCTKCNQRLCFVRKIIVLANFTTNDRYLKPTTYPMIFLL